MGKRHGSITSAGKVKNQTPKVEKQDKKKALTGRAKKRMQYNRRFISVVHVGARGRPNSQNVASSNKGQKNSSRAVSSKN